MPRRLRTLLVLLACALASGALPTNATAMTGGYATHSWPGCGGGFNSGGLDDAGRVYVPCGNPSTIGVYDETATLVQTIVVDYFVSDVAPTRDGHYLYLATGGESRRLVRTGDGSYVADPTWAPAQYSLWGSQWTPRGHFVTTDAAGRVYLADGYWSANNTHTVLVYEPTGALVTRFGEWAEESWTAGHFYWALGGVAVSADGATVYTTEAGNNRVQRWTRQLDDSYLPTRSVGPPPTTRPARASATTTAGSARSPRPTTWRSTAPATAT
jgi:DNA-binding beta-propeller fold protein YncE